MPYVSELSNSGGIDPNQLYNGMAQNISYFRQKRDQRVNAINEMKQQLANQGLADQVNVTIDENNAMNADLTTKAKGTAGLDPNSNYEAQANDVLYNSGGADLSREGAGKNTAVQDLSGYSAQRLMAMRQGLANTTDTRGYNQALNVQNEVNKMLPIQDAMNKARENNINTAPDTGGSTAVQDQKKLADQNKSAVKDMIQPSVDAANALGDNAAKNSAPAQTTDPTNTQVPPAPVQEGKDAKPGTKPPAPTKQSANEKIQNESGGSVTQANGVNDSIGLKSEGKYNQGEIETSMAQKKTITSVDPTYKDELKQDLRKLGFQRSLAGIMHNTLGGATDRGAAEMQFAQDYETRLKQLEQYNTLMNTRGVTENIDYDKAKIKGAEGEAKGEIRQNENAHSSTTITSNLSSTSSGNHATSGPDNGKAAGTPVHVQVGGVDTRGVVLKNGNYGYTSSPTTEAGANAIINAVLAGRSANNVKEYKKDGLTYKEVKNPDGSKVTAWKNPAGQWHFNGEFSEGVQTNLSGDTQVLQKGGTANAENGMKELGVMKVQQADLDLKQAYQQGENKNHAQRLANGTALIEQDIKKKKLK